MKIYEITEEIVPVNDTEHAIERLKVAADLCNKMGDQPILYRAMKGTDFRTKTGKLIVKVKNPPRESVMGNHNPIQLTVLKGLDIKSPAQATTVAPESTTNYFGTNSIMIPSSDFTAYWNPDIDDLGGFDGYDPKYKTGAGPTGGTLKRDWNPDGIEPGEERDKILKGYKTGIPSYSEHKGEVIVDTPFYYLLNLETFLSSFGGKKVKELITVDNKATFSPIKKDLLVDKFKTYRDVGWYLANPAINMMKWIADKEKERGRQQQSS